MDLQKESNAVTFAVSYIIMVGTHSAWPGWNSLFHRGEANHDCRKGGRGSFAFVIFALSLRKELSLNTEEERESSKKKSALFTVLEVICHQ